MNYYPHHIKDFNNSTRHLTRVERSVYRDAIEHYYDTEQALTLEVSRLEKRLLCRSDEEKKALSAILAEFFTETSDGFIHDRCDHEIDKYRANTSAKAKAGRASAVARKKKATERKQNLTRVQQKSTSAQRTSNQEPVTSNQEPIIEVDTTFTKPSLSEITDYCNERQSTVNAQAFFYHYENNGWKVGKNKMKSWHMAVAQWETRDKAKIATKPKNTITRGLDHVNRQ